MGFLKGSSKRQKESLERLSLVSHDVSRDVEELDHLAKQVSDYQRSLEELEAIREFDQPTVELIAACFEELGETFVEPKAQGLSLPTTIPSVAACLQRIHTCSASPSLSKL